MKALLVRFLILALAAATLPAQLPNAGTAEVLAELTKITGLPALRAIEQQTMSRSQLKAFFEERLKEVVKPEEIRVEELVLKKFGLVPEDFDLKKTTIELMTEQAAAFYDYRKKKMVLLDSAGEALQQIALIHELAHALADQHFHLEKYLKKASSNDDGALARTAVMEGQATWLMSEYMARRVGQSLRTSPEMVQMMSKMAAASGGTFPVFESVPLYLRESLLFPYVQGMRFQQEVVLKLGNDAFSEVFRRPPASTQQVLHPEKYFERVAPAEAKLPEFDSRRGWRKLTEGTVGEFDHMILFRQYAPEEESAAAHWRGGAYRLWERRDGKRSVLAYASVWESPDAARRAFQAYQRVLKGKWKLFAPAAGPDATVISGAGDDGRFVLRLDGARVTSLEGLEESR